MPGSRQVGKTLTAAMMFMLCPEFVERHGYQDPGKMSEVMEVAIVLGWDSPPNTRRRRACRNTAEAMAALSRLQEVCPWVERLPTLEHLKDVTWQGLEAEAAKIASAIE